MDNLFENAFRGFGISPFASELFTPLTASGLLKPQVDVAATDKEYLITVEVPGVGEKDVKIEVAGDTMTIRGEKKQEKEEKEKNYYRVERSYGSFQRVLSLPEDADQEDIKAKFENGVLTITMPRKALPKPEVKEIEIR
jgi:HSP20 family protein